MNPDDGVEWRTYEQVATHLLNHLSHGFGLSKVEPKQKIHGYSGATWEIDAKGVKGATGDVFVVVECKRWTTSRLEQEDLAAIAYRIGDIGASGGIVVSPLGLQEGARKIAGAERIVEVKLSAESTTTDFVLQFLNQILFVTPESIQIGDKACIVLRPDTED